jgi:hypothetical protein
MTTPSLSPEWCEDDRAIGSNSPEANVMVVLVFLGRPDSQMVHTREEGSAGHYPGEVKSHGLQAMMFDVDNSLTLPVNRWSTLNPGDALRTKRPSEH